MQSQQSNDIILDAADISHVYHSAYVLDRVSLQTRRGEFLTILGESGSGKTTMLRIISGLETPTHATRLEINGANVLGVPASQRDCTTVFQSYALFPHMSVAENVAYGLRLRKVGKEEMSKRTEQALAMVRLDQKGDRRINQLSGGERQRVALARALVTRPSILLLDEPLGALDEKLRQDMQTELIDIHRSLGTTFIYITHSQEEALTMSDRIVLMRNGRIEQRGNPEDLFDRPCSRFAASFMGFENLLAARVLELVPDGSVAVDCGGARFRGFCADTKPLAAGQDVVIAIRAERISPIAGTNAAGSQDNVLPCAFQGQTYRGKYTDVTASSVAGPIRLRTWDRGNAQASFNAISCRVEDCVILSS
ncbi:ABC transporter ATP-binding protein [Bradyrhizobium sp. dw_78]|uniref:ABC transporter ATP-binding protein n=1 Tax=Bradyrhizobium sp. dw_78 TaxID=2719793 RepID=UPI001BD2E976|nr:ABC transporter ATP-binding protein [Bradyrhizobium sp. dw_78]